MLSKARLNALADAKLIALEVQAALNNDFDEVRQDVARIECANIVNGIDQLIAQHQSQMEGLPATFLEEHDR